VRPCAPVGPTPILRERWPREPLSAVRAISPEGQLYFRSQGHASNADDVVACLEHLLREAPRQMALIGAGAPTHRSHRSQEFLAQEAAPRLPVERLPASAPDRNPGEGRWQQREGGELRNVCGLEIPHLRGELRDAVKRGRRNPRILKGCFQGAGR
jgi:DDE superfamily endonuclease